jgi:hypothetical protein
MYNFVEALKAKAKAKVTVQTSQLGVRNDQQ